MSLVEKIEAWMEKAGEWESIPVVEGRNVAVYIVKLPERERKYAKKNAKVALHIKKRDAFKGIFVTDAETLEELIQVLQNGKVKEVAKAVDEINSEVRVFL